MIMIVISVVVVVACIYFGDTWSSLQADTVADGEAQ